MALLALFALATSARAAPPDAAATNPTPDPTPDTPDTPIRGAEAEGPMSPAARALYERGLSLYQQKDYAGATRAFEDGFALDPRPEFLFANAQARRLAGDCRGAVPLYQRFLEKSPTPVQTSATHIALARCAQQMARERPAPAPLVVAPPAPPPAPPPPWTHDRVGGALLGAGVLGLAAGSAFVAAAYAARPPDAGVAYPDFKARWSTADERLAIGVAALAAGGALAVGGAARYLWVRRHARAAPTPPEVRLGLGPSGLVVAGSF